jgi:dienelactone hydrolase
MNLMTFSNSRIVGRIAVKLFTLMSFLLALMSIFPALAQQVEIIMPAPTGIYPVGRVIYEWTDSTRQEIYSDDPEAKRELAVTVWYPAAPAPEAQASPYLAGLLGDIVGQQYGFTMSQIHTYAYDDAPLATGASAYPVLVFSHGNGSILGTYSALLQEIASHGYIVVGINHTYNAIVSVFSDGRIIPASDEATSDLDAETIYWVEDTAFTVDRVEALNNSDARFADKLDLARLGVFGHSYGGAIAVEFCLIDTRCQAGINLDGSLRGESASQGVSQPFMQLFSQPPSCADMVAAGGAPDVEQCEAAYERTESDWQRVFEGAQVGYQLTIAGMTHNYIADNGFLLPLIPSLEEGATIDPERALRITTDYVLAFFDQHLKGEAISLLDAPSADYPEVTFERHEQ